MSTSRLIKTTTYVTMRVFDTAEFMSTKREIVFAEKGGCNYTKKTKKNQII
jgi:hypothetical protein